MSTNKQHTLSICLQLSRLELGLGRLLSEIVELTLKTRNLGIVRRDGLISRLDDVCRLLQPLLEVLVLTALRVHVQRPGGILSGSQARAGSPGLR